MFDHYEPVFSPVFTMVTTINIPLSCIGHLITINHQSQHSSTIKHLSARFFLEAGGPMNHGLVHASQVIRRGSTYDWAELSHDLWEPR